MGKKLCYIRLCLFLLLLFPSFLPLFIDSFPVLGRYLLMSWPVKPAAPLGLSYVCWRRVRLGRKPCQILKIQPASKSLLKIQLACKSTGDLCRFALSKTHPRAIYYHALSSIFSHFSFAHKMYNIDPHSGHDIIAAWGMARH
jgi:hypothetical protein